MSKHDLLIAGKTWSNIDTLSMKDTNGGTVEYIAPSGTVAITNSGTHDVKEYASATVVKGSAKTPTTTITATPSISINSTTGKITSVVSGSEEITPEVTAGYISSGTGGTVSASGSATLQLNTKGATTITPSTFLQTAVAKGVYTTGLISVASIPAEYADTSDATASAAEILKDYTAYVNGSKLTGTMPIYEAITIGLSPGDTYTIPKGYHNGEGIVTAQTTYVLSGSWLLSAEKIYAQPLAASLSADNIAFELYYGADNVLEGEGLTFSTEGSGGLKSQTTWVFSKYSYTWYGEVDANTYPTAQLVLQGSYEVSVEFYNCFMAVATPIGGGSTGSLQLQNIPSSLDNPIIMIPQTINSSQVYSYFTAGNQTITNVRLYEPFFIFMGLGGNPYIYSETTGVTATTFDFNTNGYYVGMLTAANGSVNFWYDCCFDGSSLVLMGDGTVKALADVQVGDEVMTYNETTQEMESNKVTALGDVKIRNIARIILDDGTKLSMNIYHPLYTEDGWKSLTEYKGLPKLTLNDKLLTSSGEYIKIQSIDQIQKSEIETYYTLKVEGNNNFYVNNILAQGKNK